MTETPNYFALIPANVRYDKRLKPNEKLLFAEITALCNKTGECWATNQYFADLYEVHKNTIGSWIKHLKELDYLDVKIVYKDGTREILKRAIRLKNTYGNFSETPTNKNVETYQSKDCNPPNEKIDTPINEIIEENNTRMNNTRLIKKEINKEKSFSDNELDFVDEEYKDTFYRWLSYKKEKRKGYKTLDSKKTCYRKLLKLANNSPSIAKEIVEQSIGNNWDGLFVLKQNFKVNYEGGYKTFKTYENTGFTPEQMEEIRRFNGC